MWCEEDRDGCGVCFARMWCEQERDQFFSPSERVMNLHYKKSYPTIIPTATTTSPKILKNVPSSIISAQHIINPVPTHPAAFVSTTVGLSSISATRRASAPDERPEKGEDLWFRPGAFFGSLLS